LSSATTEQSASASSTRPPRTSMPLRRPGAGRVARRAAARPDRPHALTDFG